MVSKECLINPFPHDKFSVWTNGQCPKSEAAVTVRPKSVSCSKQVHKNRLPCENYII